jgi:hypothetical protein
VNTLTLSRGELRVVDSPDCGGAIIAIYLAGIQIMALPPKPSQNAILFGGEDDWVRAWKGGWQPLLPNAGTEFLSGRYPQGFHGNASQAVWKATQLSAKGVELRWDQEDLHCLRLINITEDQTTVSGKLINSSDQNRNFIITEHVIFGDLLFSSDVKLDMNDQTKFMELRPDGTADDYDWHPWSEISKSDWSTVGSNTPARMGVISNVDSVGVKITGESIEAKLTWDTDNLPYAWLWEEMGASKGDPWNGEYLALGIEPSTTSHGAGLGEALRTGTAKFLDPKEEFRWWVILKLKLVKEGM